MLGALNVVKPTGWTSSDVVVKLRWLLREYCGDKKIKVGHLGTLDPAGSGVLPIVFGKATRLFDYYVGGDKLYRATFTFGKTTDTLDSYGVVTDTSNVIPEIGDLQNAIGNFIGVLDQIPPQYSRIAVDGKRACDVARSGGVVDIKSRKITVFSIDILQYNSGVIMLDIHCSGGTYIRSICRDLAESLGGLAYMSSIIRLSNKSFHIENTVTIDELYEKGVADFILPVDELLKDEVSVIVKGDEVSNLMNGINIPARGYDTDYVVKIDGKIFGICKDENEVVKVLIRLW